MAQTECAIKVIAKPDPIKTTSQKPGPIISVRNATNRMNTKTPNEMQIRNLYSLRFLISDSGMALPEGVIIIATKYRKEI